MGSQSRDRERIAMFLCWCVFETVRRGKPRSDGRRPSEPEATHSDGGRRDGARPVDDRRRLFDRPRGAAHACLGRARRPRHRARPPGGDAHRPRGRRPGHRRRRPAVHDQGRRRVRRRQPPAARRPAAGGGARGPAVAGPALRPGARPARAAARLPLARRRRGRGGGADGRNGRDRRSDPGPGAAGRRPIPWHRQRRAAPHEPAAQRSYV